MMTLFIYLKLGAALVPFGTLGTFPPAICLEEKAKLEKSIAERTYPFGPKAAEELVVDCVPVPPAEDNL